MAFCYVNGHKSMTRASVTTQLSHLQSKTVIFFRNLYKLKLAYFTQVVIKYLFRSLSLRYSNFPCTISLGISDDTTNPTSLETINILQLKIEMEKGKDKQYEIDLTNITKSNILSKNYVFVTFQCNVNAALVDHHMDFVELHMRFKEGGKFFFRNDSLATRRHDHNFF